MEWMINFECEYCDLCQLNIESTYFATFIDELSCYTWLYLMKYC